MNIEPIWKEFYAPLKGVVCQKGNDHAAVDGIVRYRLQWRKSPTDISELKDSQKIRVWDLLISPGIRSSTIIENKSLQMNSRPICK